MEPKEHHQKTRLTKNQSMTIVLSKVMASLNCGPLGHAFGAMARAPALFFLPRTRWRHCLQNYNSWVVDFNFTFLCYRLVHVPTSINRKVKLKSTKAVPQFCRQWRQRVLGGKTAAGALAIAPKACPKGPIVSSEPYFWERDLHLFIFGKSSLPMVVHLVELSCK